jgi:nucleoside phosphorylase
MESSAILGQCIDRRVPCGVLRIVSDFANAEAMHAYKERAPKVLATLGAEAARLVELLHEREAARLARKA